jgi:riboflavin synthase
MRGAKVFTGIVEGVGQVAQIIEGDASRRLRFAVPPGFVSDARVGDSISVDGACLTVVEVASDAFDVDVIATTLGRTVAGTYEAGHRVNLERALKLGTRLDGHLVQGHVDGVGHLTSILEEDRGWRMQFSLPADVHAGTILHGSITLNGVSLTVNRILPEHTIEVGIIPHTWEHTNLGALRPGAPVNVEGDLMGKYVRRWLEAMHPALTAGASLTPPQ